MRIQHNIPALSAYRNYTHNVSAVNKNLEKLSSGYRINRAGDDAAGLAISEKMRAQISGLEQAQSNAKSGINLVQTAEGAMTEIHDMLNRMYTLAEQSANGTYSDDVDREQLQKEVNSLRTEINRIADATNYNGINLLDGSLDANNTSEISADSAISNIVTQEYAAQGASPAFEASYVTNRPEAATKQKNAVFEVNLDDIKLTGMEATDTVTLKVGDAEIKATLEAADIADVSAVINKLVTKGGKTITVSATTAQKQTDDAAAVDKADTDSWETQYTAAAANSGSYVKIDGHFYEMTAVQSGGKNVGIKFSQVDCITDGQNINPDFAVSVTSEDVSGTGTGKKELVQSGTVNPQVQVTKTGEAIGSSHQAQAKVEIDFTQLKDGDRLIVGEKSFVFKIGAGSTTDADTGNYPGDNLVDLSTIFKTDSDLLDAGKQAKALDKLVETMGPDTSSITTWSTGNGGVKDGKGTLTFQSLSSFVDDSGVKIGSGANNEKCNMSTEDKVMKQFYSERGEVAASTSFDVDVTKIKEGDTFTVGGNTFEFTDGDYVTDKNHIKIDLSSYGIDGGIQSSKSADVVNAIKTAMNTALTSKYDISVDGNTVKLSSKDDTDTSAIKESRIAPEVKLSEESYAGKALTLQIGDTADDYNKLAVNVKDMHAKAMGIGDIDISSQDGASAAMKAIKDAVNYVSDVRGDLGALQNRLDHTINNLSVTQENITDAESNIRDVDIAKEMMAYTKNNILVQSAQAMLAQANQLPQGVLQLLG